MSFLGLASQLAAAGVHEIDPPPRAIDGDAAGAFDVGVGDGADLVPLAVEHADGFPGLLDHVEALVGVQRDTHRVRQRLDGGERLLSEVEAEHRPPAEVGHVQPLSVVRDREPHGLRDALRRRLDTGEQIEDVVGEGRVAAQIVFADDSADELDAGLLGRGRPHQPHLLHLLGRRGTTEEQREGENREGAAQGRARIAAKQSPARVFGPPPREFVSVWRHGFSSFPCEATPAGVAGNDFGQILPGLRATLLS